MANVTYRACWVDDYSALALGSDLMVHCDLVVHYDNASSSFNFVNRQDSRVGYRKLYDYDTTYLKVVRKCIL